jgi:hypothetical protein
MGGALLVRNSPSGIQMSGVPGSSVVFLGLNTLRSNSASGATTSEGAEVPLNLALGKLVMHSNAYQVNLGIESTMYLTDGNLKTTVRLRSACQCLSKHTSWLVLDVGKEYDLRLIRIFRGTELGSAYGGYARHGYTYDFEDNYYIRIANQIQYTANMPAENDEFYSTYTLCKKILYLGLEKMAQATCSVGSTKHRYIVVHRETSSGRASVDVDITEIQVFTDVGRGGGVALLSGTSMQIKDSMVNEGVTSLIANEAFRGGGLYLEEATSLNIGTDDNNEGLIEVSQNHAKVREWLLMVGGVGGCDSVSHSPPLLLVFLLLLHRHSAVASIPTVRYRCPLLRLNIQEMQWIANLAGRIFMSVILSVSHLDVMQENIFQRKTDLNSTKESIHQPFASFVQVVFLIPANLCLVAPLVTPVHMRIHLVFIGVNFVTVECTPIRLDN